MHTDAWQIGRRAGTGHTESFAVVDDPLVSRHRLGYAVARSNLHALATTVPATSRIDYWLVLEILDSLHDPSVRPIVDPLVTGPKQVLYTTARAAIEGLSDHGLDPRLLLIRDLLDGCWQRDLGCNGSKTGGGA